MWHTTMCRTAVKQLNRSLITRVNIYFTPWIMKRIKNEESMISLLINKKLERNKKLKHHAERKRIRKSLWKENFLIGSLSGRREIEIESFSHSSAEWEKELGHYFYEYEAMFWSEGESKGETIQFPIFYPHAFTFFLILQSISYLETLLEAQQAVS